MLERLRATVLGERMAHPPDLGDEALPAGIVLRRGRLIPWLGGRLAGMRGRAAAVTLGRTIIIDPDARLTRRLLAHELTHVRQWEGDRLFPLRYSLATLRHGYRNNPYEVEAREVEAFAARTQAGEEPSEWRDQS